MYVVVTSTSANTERAYGPIELEATALLLATRLRAVFGHADVVPLADPLLAALVAPEPGGRDEFEIAVDQLLEAGLVRDATAAIADVVPLHNQTAAVEPGGCRHCGLLEREHFQRWTTGAGWHRWTEPTDAQRLERMRARRDQNHTKKAAPEPTGTADHTATPERTNRP